MKTLIINNRSKHLQSIQELFPYANVVDFEEYIFQDDYEFYILTGGGAYSVTNHSDRYHEELKLLQESDKPILGICLGFQLLCFANGESLEHKELFRGSAILDSEDVILHNKEVYCSHQWFCKKVHALTELARSEQGIEVVIHPTKPQLGVQFHPEVTEQGKELLRYLLQKILV